ncbi:hypothetical protein JEM67_10365 [Serratia sp. PAMC26656]|uniref:hypothetical protein n=1 Tax=Serratia sp. PAMC26656 TaxID=2775909 RepID=UPI0018F33270|nr:hypothetical protein [Serratia sp. PAMC26656]MBJ7892378.1 hypothetical protein [Serratia sp. PAMC26656]
MKDYKASLLAGIAAAKKAADNKKEVHEVINTLSSQVMEISDSKATFGIVSLNRRPKNDGAAAIIGLAHFMALQKGEEYFALCVFDEKNTNGIEIAEWLQDDAGYPCTIKYNGQQFFCSNKTELENSLAQLLKEVKTGEAILKQISKFDSKLKPSDETPT